MAPRVRRIEAYEDEHYPMPMGPIDPTEAIKCRMEERGLTRKNLEPLIGSRVRVAEVLKPQARPHAGHDPAAGFRARNSARLSGSSHAAGAPRQAEGDSFGGCPPPQPAAGIGLA
jgi:hypothetical protein